MTLAFSMMGYTLFSGGSRELPISPLSSRRKARETPPFWARLFGWISSPIPKRRGAQRIRKLTLKGLSKNKVKHFAAIMEAHLRMIAPPGYLGKNPFLAVLQILA